MLIPVLESASPVTNAGDLRDMRCIVRDSSCSLWHMSWDAGFQETLIRPYLTARSPPLYGSYGQGGSYGSMNEFLYCDISSPISPARACPDIAVSLGCDSVLQVTKQQQKSTAQPTSWKVLSQALCDGTTQNGDNLHCLACGSGWEMNSTGSGRD